LDPYRENRQDDFGELGLLNQWKWDGDALL
jgi:hypothetical protein